MSNKKEFSPPPQELIERWIEDSKRRPTLQAAYSYIAFKSAEWGFCLASEPDPSSLKQRALRGLNKLQGIEVVSIWVGKDIFDVIRAALNKVPDDA